jgi:hypothetical protein
VKLGETHRKKVKEWNIITNNGDHWRHRGTTGDNGKCKTRKGRKGREANEDKEDKEDKEGQ